MTKQMIHGNNWRMFLVVSAVVLLGGVLFAWVDVLFPVLAAFVIAFFTHPLASFFERHKMPRIFGFVCILLILLGLFVLIFFVFLPAIVHELMSIGEKFPIWQKAILKHIGSYLADLQKRYPEAYATIQDRLTQWAQENLPSIGERLLSWSMGMMGSALGLVSILLNLVLIPVIAVYLTIDFHKIGQSLRFLIPRPVLPTVEKIMQEVVQVLRDFLRGQLLVAILLGLIYTAGLLLVQAPLALVIGPLAGLFSLVPYLGFIFGIGTAILLTVLEYQDVWHPMGVLVTFAIAQTIEGWFLTPNFLGKKIGLHPVWVLIALLLGGKLFGFAGILVGVPVAAVLRVVLRHAVQAYQQSSIYLGKN